MYLSGLGVLPTLRAGFQGRKGLPEDFGIQLHWTAGALRLLLRFTGITHWHWYQAPALPYFIPLVSGPFPFEMLSLPLKKEVKPTRIVKVNKEPSS